MLTNPPHTHTSHTASSRASLLIFIIMTGSDGTQATFQVYSKIHSEMTPYLSVASDHVSAPCAEREGEGGGGRGVARFLLPYGA